MKRIIAWVLLLSTVFCLVFACIGEASADNGATDHEHEWEAATFSKPKTCSICGKTEGEPVNGPVYTPFGFCLGPYQFMYIYDRALKQIQYHDWITGLVKEDGMIVFDSTYKIKIGEGSGEDRCSSMDWFNIYPYLNFEGNDNFLEPMKQVSVEFGTAKFLLQNYTDTRSWILGFYAALVLAIEPDITTIEDAMEISDAAFAVASGGNYIHHSNTSSLPKIPAVYKHGNVVYTVDIKNGNLFMTATIDAISPLKVGSSGNVVKEVQKRLIELNYLGAGAADGSYGNGTAGAVKEFQKATHLEETGIVDSETYYRLFKDNAIAKQ